MRSCKTLVIGAGHRAVGFAVARKGTLICEESEFCDSDFSLTLKSFSREGYQPQTEAGKELLKSYERLGLVRDLALNCSALEIGLSRYVLEKGVDILLKTRVVQVEKGQEGFAVTLLTNAGLETVRADRVVDVRPTGEKQISLLFTLTDEESLSRVGACFPAGRTERAFYPDRGVLHLPVEGDYNQALCSLHDRWESGGLEEKILLVAPRLHFDRETDPIQAFEAGYEWGKGAV